MTSQVKDKKGRWVFIIPIHNLLLTNDIGYEIKIKRVTFITKQKLLKCRRRFDIQPHFSDKKLVIQRDDFFSKVDDSLAVVQFSDRGSTSETLAKKLIKEELEILTMSQLAYSKRTINGIPSMDYQVAESHRYYALNTSSNEAYMGYKTTGKWQELVLDGRWKSWQKDFYFFTLTMILRGEIEVHSEWRNTLYRVSRLIGQSISARSPSVAFLLNMIAIEALLTRPQDKYSTEIPRRIEAFIGWVGYWNTENYEDRIRDIYAKRCSFVHDGVEEGIEIRDLLFTDDVLFNLLYNIVGHYKIFSSKEKVIEFSDKVAAEKTLGIIGDKSKVRPKTMQYLYKTYTKKDFEQF